MTSPTREERLVEKFDLPVLMEAVLVEVRDPGEAEQVAAELAAIFNKRPELRARLNGRS